MAAVLAAWPPRSSRNDEQTCRHSGPDRRGVKVIRKVKRPSSLILAMAYTNMRKEGIANLSIDCGRLGTVDPLRGVQARVTYVLQRQNKASCQKEASFTTRLVSKWGFCFIGQATRDHVLV